jgi:hypothetical protein
MEWRDAVWILGVLLVGVLLVVDSCTTGFARRPRAFARMLFD